MSRGTEAVAMTGDHIIGKYTYMGMPVKLPVRTRPAVEPAAADPGLHPAEKRVDEGDYIPASAVLRLAVDGGW